MKENREIWPPHLLREWLEYDPDGGSFRWRFWRSGLKSMTAGTVQKGTGRRKIRLPGARFYASNVAWAIVTGMWPEGQIDHRNLNPGDDRWDNLRLASPSQNGANKAVARNNSSGAKGVCYRGDRYKSKPWQASIACEGKTYFLGMFETKELAGSAYAHAAKEMFGEYGRAV